MHLKYYIVGCSVVNDQLYILWNLTKNFSFCFLCLGTSVIFKQGLLNLLNICLYNLINALVLISCSHFCNLVLSAAFFTAQMALTNDTDIIVGLVFSPDFAGVHARVAMSLVRAQTTWNSQDNESQPGWISWLERVDYSYAVLQHTSSSFSPVHSHLHSAEHQALSVGVFFSLR